MGMNQIIRHQYKAMFWVGFNNPNLVLILRGLTWLHNGLNQEYHDIHTPTFEVIGV